MGRSAANRRIAKERAAEQARRDAAFFENFKRNEIDSFVRAGDARQVANTYGRTESGLSNIPPEEGTGRGSPNDNVLNPGASRSRLKTPFETLRYPDQILDEFTDYLQISIVEYKPVGKDLVRTNLRDSNTSRRNSNSGKKLIRTIILPIPSNVQDGNTVDYDSNKLGSISAAAVSGVTNITESAQSETPIRTTLENIGLAGNNLISTAGNIGGIVNLINKSLASQAIGVFGGNVTVDQLLAREEGVIFNPNMELLFSGPTLRSFKFQFKMTPRNFDEGQNVKKIIREFKRSMAPKITTTGTSENSTNSLFLSTPDVFELTYRKGGGDHPYLNRFKQCALLDISVNYTGEGTYATYDDGTPVSMIMDLTFRELEPVYDSDYYNSSGEDLDSTVGY